MTENKHIGKLISGNYSLRPLSWVCLLSTVAVLSACGPEPKYIPRTNTNVDGIIMSKDDPATISHMEKDAVEKALTKQPAITQNEQMPAVPAPLVSAESPNSLQPRLNPKNLFSKSLRSDAERLDRLERAVQDMRHEFDLVKPSIKRLMAVEGDIQGLITELQKLSANPSIATPPKRRSVVTPPVAGSKRTVRRPANIIRNAAKPLQTKPTPPVQNGRANIYGIRVGEHPGKTRIVMDSNTKTTFNADIDNSEKIMIIELSNADWTAKTAQSFSKSPFIKSFKVEPTGNGQMVIFQLKRNASIGYKADIGALNGSGRRFVIDLIGG